MEEIELRHLFQIILKRWWIILIFTFSTLIVGIAYTFYIAKPVYQSDTSVYIGKNAENQPISVIYDDVLLNDRLVKDYRELVKSRLVSGEVMKEMNLTDVTYSQIAGKLNVTSKEDTHLIVITVTDVDPEFSRDLADKVAEVFKKKAVEIMKVENIQIIDKAVVPSIPVKPNKIINIAISLMIGLIAGLSFVLLIEYFNDTIKTPGDITKYIQISVIGTIPVLPK